MDEESSYWYVVYDFSAEKSSGTGAIIFHTKHGSLFPIGDATRRIKEAIAEENEEDEEDEIAVVILDWRPITKEQALERQCAVIMNADGIGMLQ